MNNSEDIDRLAQSFFIVLISCSLMNDSYLLLNDFFKNNYVKKKINYIKNICNISYNLVFNNFKNDKEGNIIIDKNNMTSEELNEVNLFDLHLDSDIDDIFEDDEETELINKNPIILRENHSETIPIINDEEKVNEKHIAEENNQIIENIEIIKYEENNILVETPISFSPENENNGEIPILRELEKPLNPNKELRRKLKNNAITITKKINNEEVSILKSNTKMIKNKKTK